MCSATRDAVTVYIVEDAPSIRERLVEMIAHADRATVVGEAETAVEAIAGIRASRPDLVLLDLHLRDGLGLDVLRASRGAPHAPTYIVLTNDPSERQRSACMAAGASHFLDKSLDFLRVTEIISTFSLPRT